MPDEPDFSPRRGVDILSQSVGNLAVELAAETIGSLAVDIATQSVGDLDVNITGSTGTLDVNLDSQTAEIGIDIQSQTISDLGIDIQNQSLQTVDQETVALPSENINFIQVNDTTNVSANGGFSDTFIRPPAGELWEIFALELRSGPVPGATSGTHEIFVRSETEAIDLLKGESSHNNSLVYQYKYWQDADVQARPPDVAAQGNVVEGARIDNTRGLQIEYFNDTDSNQDNLREYRLWVRRIDIAP